jgi:hypothetical protein
MGLKASTGVQGMALYNEARNLVVDSLHKNEDIDNVLNVFLLSIAILASYIAKKENVERSLIKDEIMLSLMANIDTFLKLADEEEKNNT